MIKIFKESGIDKVVKDENQSKLHLEISKGNINKIISLVETLQPKSIDILRNSSFVLLISYFEFLFSDLLSFFYTKHYGQFRDVKIAISDFDSFADLNEAKDFYINKEVENLLLNLKTFEEIKKHYREKLNVSLDEEIIDWQIISDARERRHLIVHNNGIINRKFLNSIEKEKIPEGENLEIGNPIQISDEYFKQVFIEIYSAGMFMIFNCWGKLQNQDMDKAFSLLLEFSYDSLKKKNYEITKKLRKYLTAYKIEGRNEKQEYTLLQIKFNCCIALKKLNKKEGLNKELSKIKISTLSPIFKVAYYTLRDEKQEVLNNLNAAKIADKLDFSDVENWVLFEEFREDHDFMEKAKNLLT